ncbi:hypothetical protein M8997_007210 [Phyllobacterium sp. 21LDTY02-6]|uniref:hypothetical protein n=1 Tax=Phyllobacterium sp. 21LDTY02-6 TaxID=2944903 RepID=UPI0020215102|nr:hypothetical protein [Phyllobacterium sp. 21LDTY02-6]MCO4316966.1 hypothetical protein [Phyllobacterium sp. 21LDTY02-6]
MGNEAIVRLQRHADLVQQLVKQVPAALNRPNLTFEQASRLHGVIDKGVRDFGEVEAMIGQSEVDASYRRAAASLAKIWAHLASSAEARVQALRPAEDVEDAIAVQEDEP